MVRSAALAEKIADVQSKLNNPNLPDWRREELQDKLAELREERYAHRVKEKIDALEARVAALEAAQP